MVDESMSASRQEKMVGCANGDGTDRRLTS
jgi:hypothetical protein